MPRLTRVGTCNQGMCPGQELNPQTFGLWDVAPNNQITQPRLFSFIPVSSTTRTGLACRRSLSISGSDWMTNLFSRIASGDLEGLSFTNMTLFCARLLRACHQQPDEVSWSCRFSTGGSTHVLWGKGWNIPVQRKLCRDEPSGQARGRRTGRLASDNKA